jgi:transposase
MEADAYAGFNRLYDESRKAGPIIEAACWAHYLERIFMWSRCNHRQHPR